MDRAAFCRRLAEALEATTAGDVSSFADKVGVSRATMYVYLKGGRVPDVEVLSRIATASRLSPSYLLTGLDAVKPSPVPADEQRLLAAYRAAGDYRASLLRLAEAKAEETRALAGLASSGNSPPERQGEAEGTAPRRGRSGNG